MNALPYNIIGDIHGMDVWKSLVKDDCINIFVGDFFDPYTRAISFDDCKRNFLDIIDYKKAHPETIILYGNHEIHYLFYGEIEERYSRFDENHAEQIQHLLRDNAQYFNGIAYSINNLYLVTHAGVSRYWFHRYFGPYSEQTPNEVTEQINNLWQLNYRPFLVRENKKIDITAEGPTQSPLWIRPWIMEKYNLFEGTPYKQIFGHTICREIKEKNGLICVDCLRWVEKPEIGKASLIIIQY